uniref:Uncharacterized protein n=1 Tax=Aegilops tauschii subsp. strangulata TaxID=200361 RepID=A0A453MC28_AEGTS
GAPTSPRAHPPLFRLGRARAPPALLPPPWRRPRVPLRPPPPRKGAAGRRQRRVRLLLVAARSRARREGQRVSALAGFQVKLLIA